MICEEPILDNSSSSSSQNHSVPDDLVIFKELNKAKFSVLGAYSPSLHQNFAVKIFPYQNNQVNPYFLKEAYFMQFNHPNLISITDCRIEQVIPTEVGYLQISCIVMELAPFGDFFDIIMTRQIKFSEQLARTFFHELVEGIEYLHSKGSAHLDLKLENLLLGEDFKLKIADFDTAYIYGQTQVQSKGTKSYRAPEILNCECKDPQAADIYSMGVILFIFKCQGKLPYKEQTSSKGVDFLHLLKNDKSQFWEKQREIQRRENSFFSQDFKDLFEGMMETDPTKRTTIYEIKNSTWYKGPTLSKEEIQKVFE